jgi:hypothetical protein
MVAEDERTGEKLIYYGKRNRIWYYWKYVPVHIAVWKTAMIITSSLLAAVLTGKVHMHLRPVVHAFSNLPKILKNRTPVEKALLSKVLY